MPGPPGPRGRVRGGVPGEHRKGDPMRKRFGVGLGLRPRIDEMEADHLGENHGPGGAGGGGVAIGSARLG